MSAIRSKSILKVTVILSVLLIDTRVMPCSLFDNKEASLRRSRLEKTPWYVRLMDKVDVEKIVKDDVTYQKYHKCLVGKGYCNLQGRTAKSVIPKVIKTGCAECSCKQRQSLKNALRYIKENRQAEWNELMETYDPKYKFFDETMLYENEYLNSTVNSNSPTAKTTTAIIINTVKNRPTKIVKSNGLTAATNETDRRDVLFVTDTTEDRISINDTADSDDSTVNSIEDSICPVILEQYLDTNTDNISDSDNPINNTM